MSDQSETQIVGFLTHRLICLFYVPGFESNYYAEIWDTIAGLVRADEITRIGSQFFFPQSGLPTYEQ